MRVIFWSCLLTFFIFFSVDAEASFKKIKKYFRDYNIGFNSINSTDSVNVNYQLEYENDACDSDKPGGRKVNCNIPIGENSGGLFSDVLGGFGVFFQQPFKRTGFFYLSGEIGLGVLSLSGELSKNELAYSEQNHLKELSYSLYGLRVKPYLQFGVTPKGFWPDLFVSVGPVFQAFGGTSSVNNKRKDVFILQGSEIASGDLLSFAYAELEVVFYRFKDGFVSFYSSRAANADYYASGDFFPGEIDGMSDFQVSLASRESGIKLLLNWP